MRGDLRREPASIAHALHDARHERRAVQLAHLLRDADVLVHEGLVVRDHVLVFRGGVGAALDGVRGPREEVSPEGRVD